MRLRVEAKVSGQQDADARGTKLKTIGNSSSFVAHPPCHEVGRRECPRSRCPGAMIIQQHRARLSFRLCAGGGGQRDLSLRGKIAKPLFEGGRKGGGGEVDRGSVAASGLPPKDQDTPESPGSVQTSLPPAPPTS